MGSPLEEKPTIEESGTEKIGLSDIAREIGDSVEDVLGLDSRYESSARIIEKNTVEVLLSFLEEGFDVSFIFKLSPNHKTLIPVGIPYVTGENNSIELSGDVIMRSFMKTIRKKGKEIDRINLTGTNDDGVLNIIYR